MPVPENGNTSHTWSFMICGVLFWARFPDPVRVMTHATTKSISLVPNHMIKNDLTYKLGKFQQWTLMDSVTLWKEEPNSKSLEVPLISVVVQPLSQVWLFVTPCPAARQTFLSFTVSPSLLKFMSIEIISSISPYIQKGEAGEALQYPWEIFEGSSEINAKNPRFYKCRINKFYFISLHLLPVQKSNRLWKMTVYYYILNLELILIPTIVPYGIYLQ